MRHSALRSSWAAALTLVAILVLAPQAGFATVPQTINYQGSLTDDAGAPIDGTVDMTFSLYSDSGGVTQLWTETQSSVAVTDGVFSVTLGADDVTPNLLDPSWFDNPVWLGVKVGIDPEMTPLQAIDAVGFALRAKAAEGAGLAVLSLSSSDLACATCVSTTELDFDTATQTELDAAVAAIGPHTTSLDWAALTSVPADIADGDDDTLGGVAGCTSSQVAKRNGTNTAWECAADADTPDTTLDNAAVDGFVIDGPLDLNASTTIGAKEILAGARRVLSGSATTIGFGTTGSDSVGCGVNEVATGGGYLATTEDIFAYASYPTGTPTPTGWQVDAKNTAAAGSGDIEAYVICVTATPGP